MIKNGLNAGVAQWQSSSFPSINEWLKTATYVVKQPKKLSNNNNSLKSRCKTKSRISGYIICSVFASSFGITGAAYSAPTTTGCNPDPVIQEKSKEMVALIKHTHFEYGYFVYEQGGVCKATELFTSGNWDKITGHVKYPLAGRVMYFIHSHPSDLELLSHQLDEDEDAHGDKEQRKISENDRSFIQALQSKLGYALKAGIVTNYGAPKFNFYEFNTKYSLTRKEEVL